MAELIKAREIDLIAEKSWPFHDGSTGKPKSINMKLFIECKYIPTNNVFWFGDKDFTSAKNWVIENTPLRENNAHLKEHHYLSSNSRVAKLFTSQGSANKDFEKEVIYKALNQSLNSMVYLRNRGSIIPKDPKRKNNIVTTIELPVILCNSFEKFYQVKIEESTDPVSISDNFQLEVNYAYIEGAGNHRSEYFLLDVVEYRAMDDFFSVVEKDIKAIIEIL